MKYAFSVLLACLLLCCGCTAKQPQAIPEMAVLIEVSWVRTTSSADESFWFTAGRPQWDTEAEGHFLNCEYRAADGADALDGFLRALAAQTPSPAELDDTDQKGDNNGTI